MSAASMTYDEVRTFVDQFAGGCCTLEAIELFMVTALGTMVSELGSLEEMDTEILTLVSGVGEYDLPLGTRLPVYGITDENNCVWNERRKPCFECKCVHAEGLFRCKSPTYSIEERKLSVTPAPGEWLDGKKIVIRSLPEIDYSLYVDSVLGTQTLRTWKRVALPDGLHPAFSKRVLGLVLMESNPAMGQYWEEFSTREVEQWKSRQFRGRGGDELVIRGVPDKTPRTIPTGYHKTLEW